MRSTAEHRFTYWVEEAADGQVATLHICLTDSERPAVSFSNGVIEVGRLMAFIDEQLHVREAAQ